MRRNRWRSSLLVLLIFILFGKAAAAEQAQAPGKLIHVVVALCDNKLQGIVPVPAKTGSAG